MAQFRADSGGPATKRVSARTVLGIVISTVLATTVAVGWATTRPAHQWYVPISTGGTFLPTSGPQRTVIIGPDHRIYAAPSKLPPHPDPGFLQQVPGGACTPQNQYEASYLTTASRYGKDCKRITFAFGPVNVKPGQNNALLRPVGIEQPRYDGYIVRFRPDLLRASDGSRPRTEQLHLHHGTWLNLSRQYGEGPFFAAGEEKTIADFPAGYGMEVRPDDLWGLLYMVHDAEAKPDNVWIIYQIDFVPKSAAKRLGIVPVKPLWLDVQRKPIYKGAPSTPVNPVFNVQRGFGHKDPMTHTQVCRWPDENCANFDVYGNRTPQQGVTEKQLHANIAGADYRVTKDMAGTIIGLGGHIHPGGIRDEVSLVRHGVAKPIFYSDAVYWNYTHPSRAGAPPVSWNMSMSVTGAPLDWKVKIRAGDIVRLNAVYDSQIASWYEDMGIVVGFVAPNDPHGAPGIDVFDKDVRIHNGAPVQARNPQGNYVFNYRPPPCHPDLIGSDGHRDLCLHGQITHPAIPESGDATPPCTTVSCPGLSKKVGPFVNNIYSAGFTYGAADLGVISVAGIPRVHRDTTVRFWDYDAAAEVWHTFTRCRLPCTGATGVNYPIANGDRARASRTFESMEVGYGLLWDPSKAQVGGNDPYNAAWVKKGLVWSFTPAQDGTYSFYCRVHPSMRGVFKVVG